ncbi:unnamed protein product [Gongylonema pulchrum]|uniref:Ig-like domain-containing protein n=1 Tax=Gongylonema pulchrum TaxID=637853 RepID=A0A183D043_9BILA|nr:unnamed protein product [Gongylonema pulchrum]
MSSAASDTLLDFDLCPTDRLFILCFLHSGELQVNFRWFREGRFPVSLFHGMALLIGDGEGDICDKKGFSFCRKTPVMPLREYVRTVLVLCQLSNVPTQPLICSFEQVILCMCVCVFAAIQVSLCIWPRVGIQIISMFFISTLVAGAHLMEIRIASSFTHIFERCNNGRILEKGCKKCIFLSVDLSWSAVGIHETVAIRNLVLQPCS